MNDLLQYLSIESFYKTPDEDDQWSLTPRNQGHLTTLLPTWILHTSLARGLSKFRKCFVSQSTGFFFFSNWSNKAYIGHFVSNGTFFVGHGRTMWKVYHSCGHAELKFWTLSSRKNDFRLVGYGANTLLELPGFCPCGRNMKEKYCPLLPSSCTDSFSFICPEPQLPAYSQFSLKLAPAPWPWQNHFSTICLRNFSSTSWNSSIRWVCSAYDAPVEFSFVFPATGPSIPTGANRTRSSTAQGSHGTGAALR